VNAVRANSHTLSENAVATTSKNDPGGPLPEAVELALLSNDLSKLSPTDRLTYMRRLCDSLALNWLTNPFQYIILNGKLTLYATRACADQLRKRDKVSIGPPEVRFEDGLVVVSVTARTADGREDSELGVVSLEGLRGEARANAILKAITKAKRRVTLSICGLGWMDETEVETIPGARVVSPDEELTEPAEQEQEPQPPASPTATAAASAAQANGNGKPAGCTCAGKRHWATNPGCPLNGGGQGRQTRPAASGNARPAQPQQQPLQEPLLTADPCEEYEPGANG